jgi:transcriptional regulator GlxA family with amidase domain
VQTIIDSHYSDANFSVDWLADEMGLSRRQLERRIEAVTGEAPSALIRRLRLERASQLIRAGVGTIAEVGYMVGFKSPAHFTRAFRKAFGAPPSKYRPPVEEEMP